LLNDLVIRNFAIIDNVTINFKKGLNILSGETGAGKSIIINAVNLILGGRANSEIIRTGETEATVEASFSTQNCPQIVELLNEHGFESNELIVKRTISKNGKNKIFINNSLATLAILQKVTNGLIEISAQHEHQTLQNPENHILILDSFGNHAKDIKNYQTRYKVLKELIAKRKNIAKSSQEQSSKLDFYSFQLEEIKSAGLKDGEDEELEHDRKIVSNMVRIQESSHSAFSSLYTGQNSAISLFTKAKESLEKLAAFDDTAKSFVEQAEKINFELDDLSLNIRDYNSGLSSNSYDLDSIEDRLLTINKLKKKYGLSISDILEKQEALEKKLDIYENFDNHLEMLDEQIASETLQVKQLATILHKKRLQSAKRLTSRLMKELKDLDLAKTNIVVDMSTLDNKESNGLTELGYDQVEFLCSTNIGEEPKPLAKIASGGELSRFMLAFKQVLCATDEISVYIFDEVDSGISGAQAEIVGQKIKAVSKRSQVICISHLPQIASKADIHHHVVKKEISGRTHVEVKTLNMDDRVHEISRMIGGLSVTQSAIDHAKNLIDSSN
jgi:DNA repair protein RecN (Recombination protein N)